MGELGGKYLTFTLGREEYGIPLRRVKEIIGMMEITNVPRMPSHVKGVINLRGKIIPVIDLRRKFGMEEKAYTARTCIIVLELSADEGIRLMGVAVDSVSEVVNIASGDIEPPPQYEVASDMGFLTGMGKVKSKVILLLDTNRIINTDGVIMIQSANTTSEGGQTPCAI